VSAMPLALLLTTAAATAVGAAALHAAHGLRKQVSALRTELAAADPGRHAEVPAARQTPAAEIRAAVAEALAEERERELAEARAFWAAQETRDDTPSLLGGLAGLGEEAPLFLPRQADFVGLDLDLDLGRDLGVDRELDLDLPEPSDDLVGELATDITGTGADTGAATGTGEAGAGESAELAAARRRHPSHPDFVPASPQNPANPANPAVAGHERTMARLEELASSAIPLIDVRPGPLGTLDVYVFTDGTTLCMTPGHHETAERLAQSLREGRAPHLLGGSGISGAYALTFACGDGTVFVLADRVIASL
jgi:hypothetical protein